MTNREHYGNCQVCGDFDALTSGYCLYCLSIEIAKLREQQEKKRKKNAV